MYGKKFEEKPTVEMPIDTATFKRGGGIVTAFFKQEDKATGNFVEVTKEVMRALDVYRFKFRLGAMDKGELMQTVVNESRATEVYKGWASMEPAVECRGMEALSKVSATHKSAAMVIQGAVSRNSGVDKFNSSHSVARTAKALEMVKLMGEDLDLIADIVFIYTEDGIESMEEAKKLGGGKIDYKNYPNYWDLFKVLKLSQLLGFKVFNLGKDGVAVAITEFLSTHFDDSSTPVPSVKPAYTTMPPYYNKPILTLFRENNPATTGANDAGYNPPNTSAVSEVNISPSIPEPEHVDVNVNPGEVEF